jgi:cis-3-alkyl-4-acyloxetan-2-one decarboxylase
MFQKFFDQFWHKSLRRPYRLAVPINQGQGQPVVLLHGIGSSASTWQNVTSRLDGSDYQIIAPDLLGFGQSPKPDWPKYSADYHAEMVIATIERIRRQKLPVILVGHSMGSLIAVKVASLRPDLVKHLILYQIPLYSNSDSPKERNRRRDLYFKLYRKIVDWPPDKIKPSLRRVASKMTGLNLDPVNWQAFVSSLAYTVMEQNTLSELRQIQVPIDLIYGSLDMIVIRSKPEKIFHQVPAQLTLNTITEMHTVSPRASKFIASRIKTISELKNLDV